MYVYADIIILLNIVIDMVILMLTAAAAGVSYKLWRIVGAAIIGGVYALGGVLPNLAIAYSATAKLVVSWLLIVVAFGLKPVRLTAIIIGIFYLVSFVLGGAVFGWLFFWQSNELMSARLVPDSLSTLQLAVGSLLGTGLIVLVARRVMITIQRKRSLLLTKISYHGRSIELTGLLDTGNGVYSLVGHRPVVIVEAASVIKLFSPAVSDFLQSTKSELWLSKLPECQDRAWLSGVEVILYKAIGNDGMLIGFRPDSVIIVTDNSSFLATDVVVGIYPGQLVADHHYSALLHPGIMNEVNKCGEVEACGLIGES
jgi:stage II sporulation protein GA (sporulation sigma-E factor processing peptidase)